MLVRCQFGGHLTAGKTAASLSNTMELTLEYKTAVSVALDKFATQFPDFVLIEDEPEDAIDELILRSIRELKHMADFLAKSFTVSLPAPKRNSKVSLSRWVVQVISEAIEIEAQKTTEIIEPEVVEPEVYDISLLGDKAYSRHSVSKLPLYLIHNQSLYQKTLFPSPIGTISYFQVLSETLPDIEVKSGGVANIELWCDTLLTSVHHVRCTPPSHLIAGKTAFKRQRRQLIAQNSVVEYCQLSAENLKDICSPQI